MKLINRIRSFFVLLAVPVLTFITSALVILFSGAGASDDKIQALPRLWSRFILLISGVKVQVDGGRQLLDGQPYIFAINHLSQFDIFVLQGYLDVNFRWMAKKELFQIPFFGQAMEKAGGISVDRSRGREALKSLYKAAKKIADGTSVIVFPEGTRSQNGKLQKFKSGAMVLAIKSGVPIVPVAIKGTYEVLPKGTFFAMPGKVCIKIGAPVETSQFNTKQKQELAQQMHDAVEAMLQG